MTLLFQYPTTAHVRRHGPCGYAEYSSYRSWLRDEFSFRCVFCLLRERWVTGGFHLDHFQPIAHYPNRATDYDNLLYSCGVCNLTKGDLEIPDPSQVLLNSDVRVMRDGTLIADTTQAVKLIRILDLNSRAYCGFRMMWMEIARLAAKENPELYRLLLGFPNDLPDLAGRKPPEGNTRPEGVRQSYFAQRERGELPETY